MFDAGWGDDPRLTALREQQRRLTQPPLPFSSPRRSSLWYRNRYCGTFDFSVRTSSALFWIAAMRSAFSVRLHGLFAAGLVLIAIPAQAQFQPRPLPEPIVDSVKGERYHFEFSGGFWKPSANITIASEQFGIPPPRLTSRRTSA